MKKHIHKYLICLCICAVTLLCLPPFSQGRPPKWQENPSGAPDVSPIEDLMREHGLLSRILLIYDEVGRRLDAGGNVPADVIPTAADIVRRFVEDYHEQLEETFVFPRFKKAEKLADLADTLKKQHDAGRKVTDNIQKYARAGSADDKKSLALNLAAFTRMYRPHKAREDTVLFPAFHQLVNDSEYAALGEKFENKEEELFGKNGFETMVQKVEALEKELGINELNKFTP